MYHLTAVDQTNLLVELSKMILILLKGYLLNLILLPQKIYLYLVHKVQNFLILHQ
jgi:hypothetical protein